MLFNGRNQAIKFIEDYGSMILEAKRKAVGEEPVIIKLNEEFLNEIENEEKNIYQQIFKEYFKYHSPLFLVKDLHKNIQNDKIVKYINKLLIHLRKSIIRKKIPKYENPKKVVNIVEKILNFNKQQKGKGILTPKQMLQRLPIALAQAKAGNTSENLLNEIRQIIYSLCQEKEIIEKVYNNIMNSIKVKYKNEYYIYVFGK